MKANIRRPSRWESIHVIGLDGFPIRKYQLDERGNHTKKFKKLIPRKKDNIYPHNTVQKSFYERFTSPDLEIDKFPNTQGIILNMNNCTTQNVDKKNDLFFVDSNVIHSSSEVIKSSTEKINSNDEIISSPDKNDNRMDFFKLLTHQSESDKFFLGDFYDNIF